MDASEDPRTKQMLQKYRDYIDEMPCSPTKDKGKCDDLIGNDIGFGTDKDTAFGGKLKCLYQIHLSNDMI